MRATLAGGPIIVLVRILRARCRVQRRGEDPYALVRSNAVPISTVREAEADATRLLESWWSTPAQDSPLPVDPTELARRLGIVVRTDRLPPDESGKIVIPPDGQGPVVITINYWDHSNRQRFTCAHEIGHYVQRKEETGASRTFVDYRDDLAGLGADREEIYANQFAAALLMPAHLVEAWHRRESVESLARRFGTSTQAMQLRLRNLRLVGRS
jgi:Zn-dependent peptidase ImmA (M78 family)